MVLDPNPETQVTKADVEAHPYIEFGEGERKNGPGTVSMLAGVGLVDSWLDDVATTDDWQGYVFESDDGHDPHISEDTL
jgi:hypothetical protein